MGIPPPLVVLIGAAIIYAALTLAVVGVNWALVNYRPSARAVLWALLLWPAWAVCRLRSRLRARQDDNRGTG